MVKWCELIVAIVILVFSLWPTQIFSPMISMWIVVIAAVLLLIHSFVHCKACCGHCYVDDKMPVSSSSRRKKRM